MTRTWKPWVVALLAAGWFGAILPLAAQEGTATPAGRSDKAHKADRKDQERRYKRALKSLDRREWEDAVRAFEEIANAGGTRADAALYWQAYTLNKLGQSADALAALETLGAKYADSRWRKEAQALEVEVRQASGAPVSPEDAIDADLKLMALNALMGSDPERAVPMLGKILSGTGSRKLKERALFVLSQNNSEAGRELMLRIARGDANPDVQLAAVRNLGLHGGQQNHQTLSDLYAGSTDPAVKRAVLQAFMFSGAKSPVLEVARSEQSPGLRKAAIRQLGVMRAHVELEQLYQSENDVELRKSILRAMFVGGASVALAKLAKTEKNPKLRGEAVRSLGLTGKKSAELIVDIYANESDPGVRREAINALFISGNAAPLVALARKEKDPTMKKHMIQKLSHMGTKEATDYMLEILEQ